MLEISLLVRDRLTGIQRAEILGRNQSFVSAYERGRDVVVELIQIAEALGLDAKAVLDELG